MTAKHSKKFYDGSSVMIVHVRTLAPLLAVFLMAGCGGQATPASTEERSDTSRAADTSRTHDTSATADTSVAARSPETSADTATTRAESSTWTAAVTDWQPPRPPRSATLQAVRTGRHEAFDRTVFEFAGDSLPGYHVEHVDTPVRQCGSGKVVSLSGEGVLEVRLRSTQAHTEAGQPTVVDRERTPGLPVVKDLKLTCDFEGQVTWVMGLSAPNRYRVLRLHNPARLVVDVQH